MVLMKYSVDCSFYLNSSVRSYSMVVKFLESSYDGHPENETMGDMGILGLCSFGGRSTEHLSRKYC